jgi:hypothetical protein
MYSLFLRNRQHQHRSRTAATPSSIKDDTSVSLSSWACLDTSVHGGTSGTSPHHSSDSAIRYNHTANIEPSAKAQPTRGDDASISVSSWAGIDTDHHLETPRMYLSDRAINYSQANSFRGTGPHTMARTVQPSKATSHSRESSWGQIDPEFMSNLAEHRDKAAQDLIRRRQDEKTKTTRRPIAAKERGSYSDLPGGKSCDKKLHAPRKGRPPLRGQKMISTRV